MENVELEAHLKPSNFFFSGHHILDFSNSLVPSDGSYNQSPDRPGHYIIDFSNPVEPSNQPPVSGGSSSNSLNLDPPEVLDYYDACLSYIQDMLMEEEEQDLDGYSASLLQDQKALEATEKSFYDALAQDCSISAFSNQCHPLLDFPCGNDDLLPTSSNGNGSLSSYGCVDSSYQNVEESNWSDQQRESGFVPVSDVCDLGTSRSQDYYQSHAFDSLCDYLLRPMVDSPAESLSASGLSSESKSVEATECNLWVNQTEGRRIHQRDENCCQDLGRSNKLLASCNEEECVELEKYDEILLEKKDKDVDVPPNNGKSGSSLDAKSGGNENLGKPKGRRNREKKRSKGGDVVDLRTLLTSCAQTVSSFNLKTATAQLKQLRENSSPFGSSIQRVAHYFANGLEARIAASGEGTYSELVNSQATPTGVLKSYESYVTAVPVTRISFLLANRTIVKVAEKATRIHVIDFGILYGFQWPSLIQQLSERSTGPPRLKITGIDYPERGFRPAQKLEETGRRLEEYCKRFKVPFEYHALAKKWEHIQRDDIKLEEGEMLVVNCHYRAMTLLDETVDVNCPRDAFLRFIRSLNPHLFVHGIVNGSFSAPFFITRFREALFHFISMFDMLDATMTLESYGRRSLEQNLHGEQIMNVVAREGAERVWRPETYRQWQVRILRAGFRQRSLDRELVDRAKAIVKTYYHKDFVVDEDGNWLLQGWKGRTLFAISCWIPA